VGGKVGARRQVLAADGPRMYCGAIEPDRAAAAASPPRSGADRPRRPGLPSAPRAAEPGAALLDPGPGNSALVAMALVATARLAMARLAPKPSGPAYLIKRASIFATSRLANSSVSNHA
jgi:hypothetical protein